MSEGSRDFVPRKKAMRSLSDTLQDTRRWTVVMVVVALVGVLWIWATAVSPASTTGGLIPSPREGFLAPDFTLQTIDGEEMTLSDLRGKVVIVNLWASW